MDAFITKLARAAAFKQMVKAGRLSPEQEAQLAEGENQWFSSFLPTYKTPIADMMSSPGKGALVGGGIGGSIGAGVGTLFGATHPQPRPVLGAGIGAAAGGLLGAGVGALSRYMNNQNIREIAERRGGRKPLTNYDLENDPVYRHALQRHAIMYAGQG